VNVTKKLVVLELSLRQVCNLYLHIWFIGQREGELGSIQEISFLYLEGGIGRVVCIANYVELKGFVRAKYLIIITTQQP